MKYLFYISKNYSIPIVLPLVEYLSNTNERFAFFVSQKVYENCPNDWRQFPMFRELQQVIAFQADFVIVPGNFVDFRIPGKKVQIFHGLGVEKKSHYKIRHFFDIYLTSGPFVTDQFKKFQNKYKYFMVEETGWPKIDYILQYPADNIRKEMNIPDGKKVVLYAPTFSNKMQSATDLIDIIPRIIKDDEIWFFKFHELMDKEVIAKFQSEGSDKFVLIDSFDITPYLHAADVLISDTSSVIYEFMVLDKPIITYRTQSRSDKGIDIFQPEELRPALDRCLTNPTEFQANRKKQLLEVNPYLDGKICERVFETLSDIQKHNKFPKKRKPLNLFRKAQLLYHEKFKKGYLR